eukprot:jgi/Chrzof1/8086/UNPLg00131.t1
MRHLRHHKSGTRDPFARSAAMASPSVVQTCEVFICYASEDKDFVEWLDRDLKRANVSTFLDSEQIVLSEWNENERDLLIRGAMTQARVIILIVSKAWVGKPYPMKELGWALSGYRSKLLPLFYGLTLTENKSPELVKQLVRDHGTDVEVQAQVVKDMQELGGIGSLLNIQGTSEPDFSCQVVREVCKKLKRPSHSLPDHLVGEHQRLITLMKDAHMQADYAPFVLRASVSSESDSTVGATVCSLEDLEPEEQKELFCWHAFKGRVCPEGFEEVVEKLVPTTGGLPMALQVIGAALCKADRQTWQDVLNRLEQAGLTPFSTDAPEPVQKLKVGYDLLAPPDKLAFVDMALWFYDEDWDLAQVLLGPHTLGCLEKRALIVRRQKND